MSHTTALLNNAKAQDRIDALEQRMESETQQVIQSMADAIREGLRLYSPGGAGLWHEQATAALKQADEFINK